MQLKKKMNSLFQFCKWIKREKQMQHFIVRFADKQISRAGKLEKAYRGRSTSFKEMSSKTFGYLDQREQNTDKLCCQHG